MINIDSIVTIIHAAGNNTFASSFILTPYIIYHHCLFTKIPILHEFYSHDREWDSKTVLYTPQKQATKPK
jgi:protein involved in ribonucleotide reduction